MKIRDLLKKLVSLETQRSAVFVYMAGLIGVVVCGTLLAICTILAITQATIIMLAVWTLGFGLTAVIGYVLSRWICVQRRRRSSP